MMKPRWKHDCDECRFVAVVAESSGIYDWYVCDKQGYRTTIGRYGNEGWEYCSYPESVLAKDEPYWDASDGAMLLPSQIIVGRDILRRSREAA